MRHVILTCKNHRNLRWSCKQIAWTGHYNHCRGITFNGTPSGKGMYSDGSGLDCITRMPLNQYTVHNPRVNQIVHECGCPPKDLILAPEDSSVTK